MKKIFYLHFICFLAASCGRKFKDLVFKGIENVKVTDVRKGESAVTLDIRYHNPNNFTALLKNAEGDAWVDDDYLGHFIVDKPVPIPANSEFLVPVKLAIEMKKILKHSFSAVLKNKALLRISGKARAGRSGFYKNFTLHYEGMQNTNGIFNSF